MINNLINRLLDFKEKDEENEEIFILINTDSDNVGYGMKVVEIILKNLLME